MITYPIVCLVTVILFAAVAAGYLAVLNRRERHRDNLAAARAAFAERRRANIDSSIDRVTQLLYAVVPSLIGIVRKRVTGNDGVVFGGPEIEAGILSFIASLGAEQFHAIMAVLTPAQQITFVELARSIRDRADVASGKPSEKTSEKSSTAT